MKPSSLSTDPTSPSAAKKKKKQEQKKKTKDVQISSAAFWRSLSLSLQTSDRGLTGIANERAQESDRGMVGSQAYFSSSVEV